MKKLILLRHGRTEGTERHLYYGATDLPLLPSGIDELTAWKKRGVYPDASGFTFVTSGMQRAVQTLRAIFGDVPFDIIEELRETNFGIFEMKSYDELKDMPAYQAWLTGDWFSNTPPGGESFANCEARMLRGLERLLCREDDTIVVCHGGTILTLMAHLFPNTGKTGYDWEPAPGLGYEIDLISKTYHAILS